MRMNISLSVFGPPNRWNTKIVISDVDGEGATADPQISFDVLWFCPYVFSLASNHSPTIPLPLLPSGTITKSDVLGHLLPAIGYDWSHAGITQLFTNVAAHGYQVRVCLRCESLSKPLTKTAVIYSIACPSLGHVPFVPFHWPGQYYS